ncbi:hypothetical protein [Spiroplasma citri]|uniref:PD-(D/E)XK endonuclease-like domain-containing protein n=1 Tax=Spiroplasma citri TaxID=2133 RepID=A0AAJ4EJT8_SPICI|nr:hypothetical protein [Spiroplasma citri]APE75098.1 hypothetical protein SCITRI_001218 [Spiroplasma citri]QED25001.1 hypothetical protein FRX96_06280 [Spiroplasma citri]QIA67354.1 hypothetical protein GMI18_06730 [Spiroplasma citri]QIA69205.1 hypothetical protein GL298_06680 [Spiroplasma citri]QIA71071.1 hypothetical protein GL981_06730 [Spiroplasma citri]
MQFISNNIKLKYNVNFEKDNHSYFIDNIIFPSITAIISYFNNTEIQYDKLMKNNELFKKATERGKIIHEFISRILYDAIFQTENRKDYKTIIKNSKKISTIKESLKIIELFYNFFNRIKNDFIKSIIMFETPLSDGKVCGAPDLIYYENNKAIVVDFKTWKYFNAEKINKAKIQITAYNYLLEKNNIFTSNIGEIWIINENGVNINRFNITNKLKLEWQEIMHTFLKNNSNKEKRNYEN